MDPPGGGPVPCHSETTSQSFRWSKISSPPPVAPRPSHVLLSSAPLTFRMTGDNWGGLQGSSQESWWQREKSQQLWQNNRGETANITSSMLEGGAGVCKNLWSSPEKWEKHHTCTCKVRKARLVILFYSLRTQYHIVTAVCFCLLIGKWSKWYMDILLFWILYCRQSVFFMVGWATLGVT